MPLVSLPAKIISILEGNISPREIAAGVCLGVFLGFIPLNGPMAFLLAIFFFVFKVNRTATLLTLPIFKCAYMLGMYKVTDSAGTYILEKANYLAGFWRWVTHMPVVVYLDINNTLIAGGIIVASTLSVPIYFISKRLIIIFNAKYSEKIKNSALARLIPSIKLMGLIGDNTAATLKNVKTQVTLNIKDKIKTAITKGKKPGQPNPLLKRINVTGIAAIAAILLVFHFSIGFIISPGLSSYVVENINKYSSAKITIDKVNIWPLTLSFSLKGMKVFDPKRQDARIAKIDDSLIKISPLGLLSRRLIFSNIYIKGAQIDIEGSSDGSFNISSIAGKKNKTAGPGFSIGSFMQKKDLFSKGYDIVKKRFAKKSKENIKEDLNNAKKVTKTIQNLPKGKLVHFKNIKDAYVFEIKNIDIPNAYVNVNINGDKIEIVNADIRLGRIAYDPENGAVFDLINLRADINKDNKPAGKFNIFYSKTDTANGPSATFKVGLKDIDLGAVRFIYEDSLPVHVVKGLVTLKSETYIKEGAIDSRNEIYLSKHTLEQKMGQNPMVGFVPASVVCDAINQIDPLKLNFNIKGTLEKPEFEGFNESLMALIKPYIANFQENIKNQGLKALGSPNLDAAVNSIKELFKNKK